MGESGALWDASQGSKPRFLFAHVPFARPGADWLGCAVTEDPVARTVPIRWLISAGSFPVRDDEGKRDLLTEDVIWKVLRGQGIREKNVKILGLACDRHHVRFADRWWVGRVFLAGGAPTRCGRGSAGHVRGRARRGACGANFLDAHAWVAVRGAAAGIRDKGHPPQQFIYQPALEKVLASAGGIPISPLTQMHPESRCGSGIFDAASRPAGTALPYPPMLFC